MALKKIMYPGQVNSRETITTSALNATDTSLTVLDAGLLPDAPNLLVLGAGSTAETVLMTAKNGNVLTLQRGFQGVPKTWALGTVIARNYTEYDYAAMLENITDVEGRLVATDNKVADNTSAIGQLSNKSFIPRGDLSIGLGIKDLNQAKTEGGYVCVETETIKYINKPPLTGWFTLLIYLGGTGAVVQEAIQNDGVRFYRHYNGSDWWSPWKEIATTDKVIPYDNAGKVVDANNIIDTSIIKTAAYCPNIPGTMNGSSSSEGFLYTRHYSSQYIIQEFRSIYYLEPKWTRHMFNGIWSEWSVGKESVVIPYNAGYVSNESNRYTSKLIKTNYDQVTAYGSVKKVDNAVIAGNVDIWIATLTVGWKNKFNNQIGAAAANLDGTYMGEARVAIFDGTIYARSSVNCYSIMFTAPYELLRT